MEIGINSKRNFGNALAFNSCLKFVKQHVRNAVCYRKETSRFRTLQIAFDNIDFEQDMMEFLQNLFVAGVLFAHHFWQTIDPDLLRYRTDCIPIQSRQYPRQELTVKCDILLFLLDNLKL